MLECFPVHSVLAIAANADFSTVTYQFEVNPVEM